MRKLILAAVAAASVSIGPEAFAQASSLSLSADSTIKVSNVQIGCDNGHPVVSARIIINEADRGLPGVIYVGSHDDAQTSAYFMEGGSWVQWGDAYFPMYAIMRNGMQDMTVTVGVTNPGAFPSDNTVAPHGNIYIGYGVLKPEKEAIVQKTIEVNAKMRAAHPEKNWPVVNPDMNRRAFVQEDLTKYVKYQKILSSAYVPTNCAQNLSIGG